MRPLAIAVLSSCSVLALFTGSAAAQARPVDAAVEALEGGHFERAEARLDQALRDPENSRGDLARVYLYRGFLDGALGRTEESRQAFERALALEPDLEAAAMMGSSVRARLEEIRQARGEAPLSLRANVDGRRIEVAVDNAPEGLVGEVQVSIDDADGERVFEQRLAPPGPWVVSVPRDLLGDDPVPVQVALASAEGVELSRLRTQLRPLGSPIEVRLAGTRELTIEARQPDRVASVDVWVGAEDRPRWSRALDPPGPWEVTLPEEVYPDDETVVQAFVRSNGPGGEASRPLALDVPRESESGSIWTNPWFWTVVGVVIAGAAVATILYVTSSPTYEVQPRVVGFD